VHLEEQLRDSEPALECFGQARCGEEPDLRRHRFQGHTS
jgi:hypothetical protein